MPLMNHGGGTSPLRSNEVLIGNAGQPKIVVIIIIWKAMYRTVWLRRWKGWS